jgi:hypothetical protein
MVSDSALAQQVRFVTTFVEMQLISYTTECMARYDPAYIDDRRYNLEVYLRGLLRLPGLIDNCPSLRNFLNITSLASEDVYAIERDAFDAIKHEYTYVYECEPDEGDDWPPVNKSRFTSPPAASSSSGGAVAANGISGASNSATPVKSGNITNISSPSIKATANSASSSNSANGSVNRDAAVDTDNKSPTQVNRSDSDDSDQDFDSDDDQVYQSRDSTPGKSGNREEGAKSHHSKFSNVKIDGRERSGSASSAHGMGASSTPPTGTSPGLRGLSLNGNFEINSTAARLNGEEQPQSPYDKEVDEPTQPEDPNDVWALSISSATNAGVLADRSIIEATVNTPPRPPPQSDPAMVSATSAVQATETSPPPSYP